MQLDKLLRLLPSKLNLRSKASARAKGVMAVKVSGEANQLVANKEQILQQAKQMEMQEMSQNQNRPKTLVAMSSYDPRTLNYDKTIAAFTKIIWLNCAKDIMQAMCADPMGREYFDKFCKTTTLAYQFNFDFICKFVQIVNAQVSYFSIFVGT